MAVALRRDDAPILFALREATGLGTITLKPGQAASKPQATWRISSALECLRLAEILEEFPMYGRKRLEAAAWIQGVRALERRAHDELALHAEALRMRRRYVEPRAAPPWPPQDRPGLLWYFGGFFTGEGWFQMRHTTARAGIKLRRDDRPLLQAFAAIAGLGRVYDVAPYGRDKPTAVWTILAHPELPMACELLDAARLRGRKRREFHVWRVGVEEFTRARREGRRRDRARIAMAAGGLCEARGYIHHEFTPTADDGDLKRTAYVEVLQAWADRTSGPLGQGRYQAARRENPHWPTCNTIALEFGSWFAALQAAGLGARASFRAVSSARRCSRPRRTRRRGSRSA